MAAGSLEGEIGAQDRLPDHSVGGGALQWRVGIDFKVEAFAADQPGHGHACATSRGNDLTPADGQFRGGALQLGGAQLEEGLARGSGGPANVDASTRHAGTAAGASVIGRAG